MSEQYGRRKDDMMADFNDLAKSLTDSQKINLKIIQNLTSINTAVNNVQNDLHETQEVLKTHDKLLVTGNGEPSLQERIRNLESWVASQKYWLRLVSGALILQTVTFAVTALIYFVRLLPMLERIVQP